MPYRISGLCFSLLLAVMASPAAMAAEPAGKSIEKADYLLGSDDLLKIDTFDHPELSLEARVSASGNITFPLLGTIHVAGLSTRKLEDLLAKRLSDGGFVRGPHVSVLVTEYQSQKVSVLGPVAKPGSYALSTANQVLDVISQAGGVITNVGGSSTAGLAGDDAILIHRDGSKVSIDLHALFAGDLTQNRAVAAGDTLVVSKAPMFYVYGQVQKPGPYKLERDMTVMQAIATGGGLTAKGSEHWMKVKRRGTDGAIRELSVKGGDTLRADDVLVINEGWF